MSTASKPTVILANPAFDGPTVRRATAEEIAAAHPARALRGLIETTKPGITRLVTMTALIGYAMAALVSGQMGDSGIGAVLVGALWCGLGTAMTASSANALNMVLEADRDALMPRTAKRPLPGGAVSRNAVLIMGTLLGLGGILLLVATISPVPGLIALVCLMVYVLVYTPLKPVTEWATIVGTIPGALPMLIGWTAARPEASILAAIEPGALTLFALMTVWQIPHFGAIAWMYREDYALGGYRILSVRDERGLTTAWWMLVTAILYVPVSASLFWAMPNAVGWVYLVVTVLAALSMVYACVRFLKYRTRARARTVFFLSIAVLPIQMLVLVVEGGLMAML